MQNAKSLLDQFLGQPAASPGPQSNDNNGGGLGGISGLMSGPGALAGGALAGGLAGLLLGGKKPKKLAKTALKFGGAALVGGLAYKAYQNWQANKTPAAGPVSAPDAKALADANFMPHGKTEQEALCRSLIRAMISAAKADGHISDAERQRISGQLASFDISDDQRAFIDRELTSPLDLDALTHDVKSPAHAAELYTASLLVVDRTGAAERGYLGMLAARLELDPDLVAHLHATTDGAAEPAPEIRAISG